MLNLLPNDIRTEHRSRVFNRAAFVWGLCALFLLLSGLMSLIPAYSHTGTSQKTISDENKEQQKTNTRGELVQEELKDYMNMTRHIDTHFSKTTFARFHTILAEKIQKHTSIAYEDISFTRSDKGITVGLRGTATNRALLINFVRDLQAVPEFTSVVLPIGDLAERDGMFKFTLTIALKS
jgi:hypothetical protein